MTRTERAVARDRSRRAETRGAVDIKQVDQALYREDLGFNLTQGGYGQYKEDETAFNTAVAKANKELTGYDAQLKTQKTELDAANKAISSAYGDLKGTSLEGEWDKYKSTFKPIRVVKGDTVEATYYLPEDAISSLHTDAFNKSGSYTGNYVDGGNYNVDLRIGGKVLGKELHDALRNASTSVQANFYETAAPQVASANKQIDSARSSLDEQKSALGSAYDSMQAERDKVAAEQAKVKAAETGRQEQVAAVQGQYEESRGHRQSLFGAKDPKASSVETRHALFGGR